MGTDPVHVPQGALNSTAKGRGTAHNPANRFERLRLDVCGELVDDGRNDDDSVSPKTQVYSDHSRSILNRIDPRVSSDLGFEWTLNPTNAAPAHARIGGDR